MAPEVLLKKNYDYLIDSFSAGIVLYILCSGGMHPFYSRGCSQKEYVDKLIFYLPIMQGFFRTLSSFQHFQE